MNQPIEPIGLLVMHYGTPATMGDVEAYYTHIRRGSPPSPEQLQDLVDRYEAIGGPSPLTKISEYQGEAIRQAVEKRGIPARLYIGTKHTKPFVADAVAAMAADGIRRAVGLVLAPHYSGFSIAAYRKYALDAKPADMEIRFIERWGTLPAFIQALAIRVSEQTAGWDPDQTLVIFTAHSLPERALAGGDPYAEELLETSRLVAEAAGVPHWTFAFQSASSTGEPWLGPDVIDVIEQNAGRFQKVVACTVGFVSDHLEVLYDLGIEARAKCCELGLDFRRAATINADPMVMDALGGLVAALER